MFNKLLNGKNIEKRNIFESILNLKFIDVVDYIVGKRNDLVQLYELSLPTALLEVISIDKDYSDILYDTKKTLIKELARDVLLYDYRTKVIIDYERIAYVEEITNVRITFDMKISASNDLDHFLDGNYTKYYINPNGINLLEVKFDEILPSYIRKITESYGYKQTSFSKYYYGRKALDTYMR